MISFKVSGELDNVARLAAVSEHRTVSGLMRRALMLYLTQAGFFESLDKSDRMALVDMARKEMDERVD